jgi:thiamine biosynthesis lipoprotein
LRYCCYAIFGCILAFLVACAPPAATDARFFYFGTVIEVRIYSEHDTAPVLQLIEKRLASWHQRFHAWQPSELTALNAALQRGETVTPAADLAAIIRRSQQLSLLTLGLFNPALGKQFAAWGFARDNMNSALPAPAAVDPKTLPSMHDLQWQHDTLRSVHRELQLDLGGIAKGFALQELLHLLRQHGIKHAMINIGGDVGVLGQTPTRPWQIAIQDPQHTNSALDVIRLDDGEMAFTSGIYARQHPSDQGPVHHIIDPRTGQPAQGNRAVTVVGRDGMLLQAASKVLLIAGEAWPELAAQIGIEAVHVVSANGQIQSNAALQRRLLRQK